MQKGWPVSKVAIPAALHKPQCDFSPQATRRDGPASIQRGRCPPQSPAPGFGEKYWSLSGLPSHSLESGGGAFLVIIFGQIFAYSAFSNSHFASRGSHRILPSFLYLFCLDLVRALASRSSTVQLLEYVPSLDYPVLNKPT